MSTKSVTSSQSDLSKSSSTASQLPSNQLWISKDKVEKARARYVFDSNNRLLYELRREDGVTRAVNCITGQILADFGEKTGYVLKNDPAKELITKKGIYQNRFVGLDGSEYIFRTEHWRKHVKLYRIVDGKQGELVVTIENPAGFTYASHPKRPKIIFEHPEDYLSSEGTTAMLDDLITKWFAFERILRRRRLGTNVAVNAVFWSLFI